MGHGTLQQRRRRVVSAPQLAQLGEGSQVGRVGGDPHADVEQPVEVAGAAGTERHGQVVEHPMDDGSGRHRVEIARMEEGVGTVEGPEPRLARRRRDPCPLVERVDESVGVVVLAYEEVPGHPDAVEIHADPAADLHEHDGERDRHADAAPQDMIEERVAWIVVVVAIAGETLADEEMLHEAVDRRLGTGGGDLVEGGDAGPDVGGGPGPGRRQQQEGLVERNRAVGRQKVGEAIRGSHGPTVANYGGRVPSIHPYLAVARPIAFAHRGGASRHPENTERAFRHALELGYTHLETDVHVTSDGVAVAFHDDRLDRVTDVEGVIAERPWADVARARVGGTEPIMRLEELLEAFPDAYVNLDPKHGAAVEPLADAILATGSVRRVMVGSFSDRRIDAVRRRVGAELAVSAGPRLTAKLVAESRGARVRADWVHAAQVPMKIRGVPVITRRFVDHLHRRDIHVHVWTVNTADEMHRLLDLGVDGIMTDETELLRDVMRDRGVWPGA